MAFSLLVRVLDVIENPTCLDCRNHILKADTTGVSQLPVLVLIPADFLIKPHI
ncbi:MAG: hypothetical protein HY245_14470 [Rhizobiales bacterium]|nr:hypothetical protein [Hyphomicrobiales bacterium]MBI3674596.1 hypothetical protein [Hyphomicrobiales bacterium]